MGRVRARGNAIAGGLGAWLANQIWPPVCPVTEEPVDMAGRLSPDAWSRLTFIARPWCSSCGLVFAYAAMPGQESETLCPACIARPPDYDRARAPLLYDDATRPLVLAFKHGGQRDMIGQFGRWMAMAAGEVCDEADLILPVALHWRRRLSRRFNQSALLAEALARETGLPVLCDCLLRSKATPSQAGRNAKARRRNMVGAFRISGGQRVQGKTVILVDDVFTTGATVSACARKLKRAGAARVHVVTLCRVVRATDVTI